MAAKVEGLDRLKRKLDRLASVSGPVRIRARAALEQSGASITGQMKAVVPTKSGALRASIRVVFGDFRQDNANVRGVSSGGAGRGDPDLTMTLVAGNAAAFYAAFVEFGTAAHVAGGKFKGAQHPGSDRSPFFFPVWRVNRRAAKARLARAVRTGLKESVG